MANSGPDSPRVPPTVLPPATVLGPHLAEDAEFSVDVVHEPETPDAAALPRPVALPDGAALGDYQILEQIAQGGMGVVYKALHRRLNRVVALKLSLTPGTDRACRLQIEAEAAAGLDHPNIVPLYEVGETNGQLYIALAFVEGKSLAQTIAAGPLPPHRAAELIEQVARAVGHAHDHGVVHRDLKPSNILLDAAGQPRVTDFGLAKQTSTESSLTHTGQVMGTPSFMPPEQAQGLQEQIGPCTDIYSLGATLYCLLTGRPPFQSATPLETLRQVVEQEPVSPRYINPAVDRDLDTICRKCLEKRPERRYVTAVALAEDLRRFLDGRPIHARPVGPAGQMLRWCRRNRFLAALLAFVGLLLVVLASGSLVAALLFREARDLADGTRVAAEQAAERERLASLAADQARVAAEQAVGRERWERYRANLAAVSSAMQLQDGVTARLALDAAPEPFRNWEWRYFHTQLEGTSAFVPEPRTGISRFELSADRTRFAVVARDDKVIYTYDALMGRQLAVLRGHTGPVAALAVSRDGTQVVSGGADGTFRVWDAASGRCLAVLPGDRMTRIENQPVLDSALLLSPDGRWLLSQADDALRLRDAATGKLIAVLCERAHSMERPQFSLDSRWVILSTQRGVEIWDATSGERGDARGPQPFPDLILHLSGDGRRILGYQDAGRVGVLFDARTGLETARIQGLHLQLAEFSPNGARVVACGRYPQCDVLQVDAASGEVLTTFTGHKNTVEGIDFSTDGKRLATASWDQTARLWDTETGHLLAELRGHKAAVSHVVFSPNGQRLVTASEDRTLRLWDASDGALIAVLPAAGNATKVGRPCFTADGSRILWHLLDSGEVRLWDAAQAERNGVLRGHDGFVYDVAFRPDGKEVASAGWDRTVRRWDPTSGKELGLLRHQEKIVGACTYNRQGTLLASLSRNNLVQIWDLATGSPRLAWNEPFSIQQTDVRAAFSPDGETLAIGCCDGFVRLRDVATGELVAQLPGHTAEYPVRDVAFRPNGHHLASAGLFDNTVRVWDPAARKQIAVLSCEKPYSLAYSADGKRLAVASLLGTVRFFDTESYAEVVVLNVGSRVYGVALSPDGTRVAAGCADTTIHLFDYTTRQEVAVLRGHANYVHAVAFSSDGMHLASASGDGTVRIWDAPSAGK